MGLINPYNFAEIPTNAVIVIIICFLSIVTTVVVIHREIVIPTFLPKIDNKSHLLSNLNTAAGCLFLSVCIINIYFIITLNLSLQAARDLFFFGNGETSIFQTVGIFFSGSKALVFYHFFIWALRTCTGRKANNRHALVFICYFLFAVSTGSRTIFYELVILSLFFLQFVKMSILLNRKVFFSLLILISFLAYTVLARLDSSGLFLFLYKYFIGSLHFFGLIFENDEVRQNYLGYLSGGIQWLVVGVLNTLSLSGGDSLHKELDGLLAYGVNLTSSITFNAHPSGYFFFYRFSNTLFLFAYPLIIIFLILLKKLSKNRDDQVFIIYIMFWFTFEITRTSIFWNSWSVFFILIIIYKIIIDRIQGVKNYRS